MTIKEVRKALIGKKIYVRYEDCTYKEATVIDVQTEGRSRYRIATDPLIPHKVFNNYRVWQMIEKKEPYCWSAELYALSKEDIQRLLRIRREEERKQKKEAEEESKKEILNSINWEWRVFLTALVFYATSGKYDKNTECLKREEHLDAIRNARYFVENYKDNFFNP